MEKSKNSKNILIINDMPGYGKVALAAMLPILSNFGHSVYNLPTALVSNTLDYGKFTILDTTEYMKRSIAVWKDLSFSFDCITTGFLASAEQVDIIREFIDSQRKEDLLVMTHHGRRRQALQRGDGGDGGQHAPPHRGGRRDRPQPHGGHLPHRPVCGAGEPDPGGGQGGGGRPAVLRSPVCGGDQRRGVGDVVWGYNHKNGSYFTIPYEFIKVHFPGTGDMFSAVLVGELLNGKPLESAVRRAMDVLETLILLERDESEKNKGIRIEKYLSVLNR